MWTLILLIQIVCYKMQNACRFESLSSMHVCKNVNYLWPKPSMFTEHIYDSWSKASNSRRMIWHCLGVFFSSDSSLVCSFTNIQKIKDICTRSSEALKNRFKLNLCVCPTLLLLIFHVALQFTTSAHTKHHLSLSGREPSTANAVIRLS